MKTTSQARTKFKTTMPHPHSTRGALLAAALLSVCLTAHGQPDASKRETKPSSIIVKDYLGKERILLDLDHDG